jgi:hypothetical protein
MDKFNFPINELREIIYSSRHINKDLNLDILNELGFFIVKGALKKEIALIYKNNFRYELDAGLLKKTNSHPTEIKIPSTSSLFEILNEKGFLDLALNFYNGEIGSDFLRVVNKDYSNFSPVFLHQDSGYQIGNFDRYSLFIALTACNNQNGGLVLYPGTHKYGYLGDAGEIRDFLPENFPRVESDLSPGDVLIMHSATWHKSNASLSKNDRTYLEVHIQNINDPTTLYFISGTRNSKWFLNMNNEEIFVNSRTQRINQKNKEIENLNIKFTSN